MRRKTKYIVRLIKLFLLTFMMTNGFWITYSVIWFAVGLPQTNWALCTLYVLAAFSVCGYCAWIRGKTMPELKPCPCPFCGGKAELKLSRRKGLFVKFKRFSHYQYVECTECHVRTKPYITTEDALMDWNTRANEKGCVEE